MCTLLKRALTFALSRSKLHTDAGQELSNGLAMQCLHHVRNLQQAT